MSVHKVVPSTIAQGLATQGYDDVLIIDTSAAETVVTPRREEIIERLQEERRESVTELAASLDRDKGAISRDLSVLFEYDIIEYEYEEGRKIPVKKHDNVIATNIL